MKVLALVACSRHRVEDFFEDAKGHLGMAQYETRSWIGWHHHMTLVALAHLFVTLAGKRLKKGALPTLQCVRNDGQTYKIPPRSLRNQAFLRPGTG